MSKYSLEYYLLSRTRYKLKDRLRRLLKTWRYPPILFDVIESLPKSARVLDAGCGQGEFAACVTGLKPSIFMVGVDISPVAVEPSVQKVTASVLALPFESGSFDLVISRHVIEHLPDGEALISELARVLKPGGRLYVECPDVRGLAWFAKPNFYDDPTHARPYTQTALRRLAGLNQLQVIRCRRIRDPKIAFLGWFYLPVALVMRDSSFFPGLIGQFLGVWIYMLAQKPSESAGD